MSISLDEMVEQVAQLPPDVAAELIERIMIRRHGGIEPNIEAQWKTEARRRIDEITSGKVKGIPAEEALDRAARAFRR